MKKIILSALCLGSTVSAFSADKLQLTDENTRVSYAIGMLTGHQWQQQGIEFDLDTYARGIREGRSGTNTLLTPEEAQDTINKFKQEFQVKQQQKRLEAAGKNKTDGELFLAANKVKPGVKVISTTAPDGTPAELQYLVLTKGSGTKPTANDVVTVNYLGTLIDGSEFDSSYKRGQPATFQVTGVIKGWTDALQLMNVGSKWKLFIPASLAYGENGRPGIPPNSTLIFEVELLEAKSPAPPVQAAPVAPLTSDIIKVPSAEEMKKGAKIEVIKPEDVKKLSEQKTK
jgi:FKBP-type peptidyl-prolyl cis-trans isomerase FklB